ncbi:MAG: leucine-rich repeat protein, partial [Clostridia bacterium]|nr:leucine-rich repeat protein [Clostridia bacterium]
ANELVTVTLPAGVTSIGTRAFAECANLSAVYVEGLVESLGQEVFYGCDTAALKVYGIVATELENYCALNGISFNVGSYWNCFEMTVDGLGQVTITGMRDHHCNTSHKYVTIPATINGMTVVGIADEAFMDDGIVSLTINAGVANFSIGERAFAGSSLTSLYLLDNGYSVVVGDDAFDDLGSGLTVYVNNGGNLTVASAKAALANANVIAITEAGHFATKTTTGGVEIVRYYDTNATKVRIPNQIGGKRVVGIGNLAFMGMDNLETVILGDYVTYVGDHAFEGCSSMSYIYLPDGLRTINKNAFSDCTSLTSLIVPSSVTTIGDQAFSGCTALKQLRISGNPTVGSGLVDGIGIADYVEIHKSAMALYRYFRNNYSISPTFIEDMSTADKWLECLTYEVVMDDDFGTCVIITGVKSHSGCANGNHKDMVIPAFIGGLPVKKIADRAFAGNNVLESVTVQQVAKSTGIVVGEAAFDGCSRLGSVNLGKVLAINLYAFRNCRVLSSVSMSMLGNTVIGERNLNLVNGKWEYRVAPVFAGCTNLAQVHINTSTASGYSGNTGYYEADGAIYSVDGTLLFVYRLNDVTFAPDSAKSIADGAFAAGGNIVNMVLPTTVAEFDASVLYDNGQPLLTRLARIYVSEDMNIVNAASLRNVRIYYPIGANVTWDIDDATALANNIIKVEYVPQSMFDFHIRVDDLHEAEIYESEDARYTFSSEISDWQDASGHFDLVTDDVFVIRTYPLYRSDNKWYQLKDGELEQVYGVVDDMVNDSQDAFILHVQTSRLTLTQVTVVAGNVYDDKGNLLNTISTTDLYYRSLAIVKDGSDMTIEYVYLNGGKWHTFDQEATAFVELPAGCEVYERFLIKLVCIETPDGELYTYYLRAGDQALVDCPVTWDYDSRQDDKLYFVTVDASGDATLAEVTLIDGKVYSGDTKLTALHQGMLEDASYEDLYRSVLVYTQDGNAAAVRALESTFNGKLYEYDGTLNEIDGDALVYEVVDVYLGDTAGAIISIRDLGDAKWDTPDYTVDVILPDYAYSNGVSYPVVEVGMSGFAGSKIESITLEGNIRAVADDAFASSKLVDIEFSNSVTTIGAGVFAYCDDLTHVKIGDNVVSVDGNPFTGRHYTLSGSTISPATALTVEVTSNNQAFEPDSDDYMLLSKDGSVLYAYYGIGGESGTVGVVSIPEGVSTIKSGAFRSSVFGGQQITKVILPTTLKHVEAGAFDVMDELTTVIFRSEMSSLGYEDGETIFNQVDEVFTVYGIEDSVVESYAKEHGYAFRAFVSDGTFAVEYSPVRGGWKIVGVNSDMVKKTMIIPSSIEYMGATYDVVEIDASVFYGIDSIRTLIIPATVKAIGATAFAELRNLKTVIFL